MRAVSPRCAGTQSSTISTWTSSSPSTTPCHGVGDAVLAEVGSTIYAVFSKVGYCYRIGGDEFCVIAQISDTAAEKYLSEFLRELTARRVKNEHLPHVSVGYACFNPVLGSVEDAIKRADRMMYHYKRKLKSEALTNDDTVKS